MEKIRLMWHQFWAWSWERRRRLHHINMVTAEAMRDIHREHYVLIQQHRRGQKD